jgi:hypothetical protein
VLLLIGLRRARIRSGPGVRITMLASDRAPSGEPLDLDGHILGFTFEDAERQADQVSLQLDNFDLALLSGASHVEYRRDGRSVIVRAAKAGAQFIIATHSPILLSCPGARIFAFDEAPIAEAIYEELVLVGALAPTQRRAHRGDGRGRSHECWRGGTVAPL